MLLITSSFTSGSGSGINAIIEKNSIPSFTMNSTVKVISNHSDISKEIKYFYLQKMPKKNIVIPTKPPVHIEMLEQTPTGMAIATAPKQKITRRPPKKEKVRL